jgi:hypothetical protein
MNEIITTLIAYPDVLSVNQDMKSHTDWCPLYSAFSFLLA